MYKLYGFALFAIILVFSLLNIQSARAVSPNIVISQIKAGNSGASRLIEIYNNSDMPVDITGWCLNYSTASDTPVTPSPGCFEGATVADHVFMNARSYALLASSQTGLKADMVLTAGLGSGTSGHVYLTDGGGNEIDRVGWGSANNAEGKHPIVLDSTKVVERKQSDSPGILVDTDNNASDFKNSTMRAEYQYGSLYEVTDVCSNIVGLQDMVPDGYEINDVGDCVLPPVDVCKNIDGLQIILPDGYELDENGDCQVDVCLNIDGLQIILPDGMDVDGIGNCITHDECPNLPDIQPLVPEGFKMSDDGCMLDLLPLQITELLPNAVGSDDGNEFIEVFNPNDSDVDLVNHTIYIGPDFAHAYSFPAGSHIGPNEYVAFSNDDINFTLVNTTSSVRLFAIDGSFVETSVYNNPKDGMAWALIDDVWQYTNRPTPGSPNLASLIETKVVTASTLQSCAANQYRSPETNRCRLLVTSGSNLTPCKNGQYRSEETNRCRSLASDVSSLTPCAEGQERNPATNRCRSVTAVLGADTLTPCKTGQERNPDTNRCRNVISTIPVAQYATEQVSGSSGGYVGWWALAGVGVVAIIYGIWEWRQEIANIVKKVASVLGQRK